jgi:hypothetical protein
LAQLAWQLADTPLFDKAYTAAKTAAIGYATKKGAELLASAFMPRNKKKNSPSLPPSVAKAVRAATQPPRRTNRSVPLRMPKSARPTGRAMRRSNAMFGRSTALPVAVARSFKQRGGSINGRQSTVVTKTEYLGDIAGSSSFVNTSYSINPGLPSSFPWLAPVASQYEEYKFRKLTYRYETDSSSTYQGTVILATDYDALDAPFSNKQLALDYKGAAKDVTWKPIRLDLDRSQANPFSKRYVRSGSVTGDLKTYDVGLFQIMTQGQSTTATVGELFVDYVIELFGAKVNNVPGASLIGLDLRSGGTLSYSNPFGTAPTVQAGSQLGVTYANGTLTGPTQTGQFLVAVSVAGTNVSNVTSAFGGGATLVTAYGNVVSSGLTATLDVYSVNFPTNGGTITFNTGSGTVTGASLVMQQMSSGLALRPPKKDTILKPLTKDEMLLQRVSELESLISKIRVVEPNSPTPRPAPTAQLSSYVLTGQ